MNSLFGKIVVLALLLIAAGWMCFHFYINKTYAISPPTDFGANASQYEIEFTPNPFEIAGFWVYNDGDATELYQHVDQILKDHSAQLESFVKTPESNHPARPFAQQSIDLLIDASTNILGDVYKPRMNLLINYNPNPDESLDRLKLLAKVALVLADEAERESRTSYALDIHQAVFTLGARLFDERYSIPQLLCGIDLMMTSRHIARLREPFDDIRFERCAHFYTKLPLFAEEQCDPIAAEILKLDAKPGDMAALVANGDPLWKIQAVLALGKLKFTAPLPSDRKAISEFLKNLQTGQDPALRVAADAALALTKDQLRQMK